MATITTARSDSGGTASTWWVASLGLAAMYAPSFADLFNGIWMTDEQVHGPIVFGISLWLLYRRWPEMARCSRQDFRSGAAAWSIFLVGLGLYVVGRSQEILVFEMGSVVWLVAAFLLFTGGFPALRTQWFSVFFMLFMVPLPGTLVDAVTMPTKMAVSHVVEHILFWIGYPVARSGVTLQIGQYMLLVADACAGLHTLFALEALGLLYLNMVRHDSPFRNLALAVLIVPISFVANVIRVMILTLVTYHFGDEAGQGFLHGFAGMVLFVTALLLIVAVDSALQHGIRVRDVRLVSAGRA